MAKVGNAWAAAEARPGRRRGPTCVGRPTGLDCNTSARGASSPRKGPCPPPTEKLTQHETSFSLTRADSRRAMKGASHGYAATAAPSQPGAVQETRKRSRRSRQLESRGRCSRMGGRLARLTRETTRRARDRKSTRLNSSHQIISYAVFCLKKKWIQRGNESLSSN